MVNCAASIDGRISTVSRQRIPLSCPEDLDRLMKLRRSSDAVAVGIGTVLSDDPALNVRDHPGRQPLRVVFDSRGRVPEGAKVLDGKTGTVIFTSVECTRDAQGAQTIRCGSGRVDLVKALSHLNRMGVTSLLVEGGGGLIFGFLSAGLVDSMTVYTSPVVIGGLGAPTIADGEGFSGIRGFSQFRLESVRRMGPGFLAEYRRDSNGRD